MTPDPVSGAPLAGELPLHMQHQLDLCKDTAPEKSPLPSSTGTAHLSYRRSINDNSDNNNENNNSSSSNSIKNTFPQQRRMKKNTPLSIPHPICSLNVHPPPRANAAR